MQPSKASLFSFLHASAHHLPTQYPCLLTLHGLINVQPSAQWVCDSSQSRPSFVGLHGRSRDQLKIFRFFAAYTTSRTVELTLMTQRLTRPDCHLILCSPSSQTYTAYNMSCRSFMTIFYLVIFYARSKVRKNVEKILASGLPLGAPSHCYIGRPAYVPKCPVLTNLVCYLLSEDQVIQPPKMANELQARWVYTFFCYAIYPS